MIESDYYYEILTAKENVHRCIVGNRENHAANEIANGYEFWNDDLPLLHECMKNHPKNNKD